jgi:hypothetical protein
MSNHLKFRGANVGIFFELAKRGKEFLYYQLKKTVLNHFEAATKWLNINNQR